MKKLLTVLCASVALLGGCDKNDPNDPDNSVPDPQGTVTLDVRSEDDGGNFFSDLRIYIDQSDNFGGAEFVSLGKMKGLGNITRIPKEGYANSVGVYPGTGYVARKNIGNNTVSYVAIYVVDYIETVMGSVIGAVVKYLPEFRDTNVKAISASPTEDILFPMSGADHVTINIADAMPFSVSTEGGSWFSVRVAASLQSITIAPTGNNSSVSPRTGKVTITSPGCEPVVIEVSQSGVAPYVTVNNLNTQLDEDGFLFFDRSTKSKTISGISSNIEWSVKSDQTWCTVTPNNNSSTNGSVRVDVADNMSGKARTANVTLSGEGVPDVVIPVKQAITWFAQGSGANVSPYLITSPEELEIVSGNYYFKLADDIDLTAHLEGTAEGWKPLPNFNGDIDGGGHTISGLWIDRPNEQYVGLFSRVSGKIHDLRVEVGPKGINGGGNVGALVGYNSSIIERCSSSGTLRGTQYVGGLIGYSSSSSSSSISNSYSTCDIHVSSGNNAGYTSGIAGYNYSPISNCYFGGTLHTQSGPSGSGTMMGIVCGYVNAIITNCYFDSEKAGTEYSYCSGSNNYSTGALTTAQMKQRASFVGWDFDTVWQIDEGVSYPTLR